MMDDMLSAEEARRKFSEIVEFLRQPGVLEANYDIEHVELVLKMAAFEYDDNPLIIGKND